MSEKELTYVLDEKSEEDHTIVGWMSFPFEFRHIGTGYLPITASDMAKIERRALQAETKAEAEEMRTKLLVNLAMEITAAIMSGHPGQP